MIVYGGEKDAVPLVASKVSPPKEAATADLLSLSPVDVTKTYSRPEATLWRDVQLEKPKVFASHQEYVRLVRTLFRRMIVFLKEVFVVNGLLGVEKDGDKIRLILNAKNANALFREPPRFELPSPDLLADPKVEKGKTIYVAKSDLSDYYHHLRVPSWLYPFLRYLQSKRRRSAWKASSVLALTFTRA